MSDIIYQVGHLSADEVSSYCQLLLGERIETTVNSEAVIIHLAQLTVEELEVLEATLRDGQLFGLSVDKPIIRADGEDYATITVERV